MRTVGIFVLIFSIVANSVNLYGQEKKSRKQRKAERVAQTENTVEQLIKTQDYMIDMGGGEYFIVTKNRIETTSLPQYSKNNSFLTYDVIAFYDEFEYKVEKSEKGGWDIYIKIELNTLEDYAEMVLEVYSDGSAMLYGDVYTKTGNLLSPFGERRFGGRGYIQRPKRNGKF